MCFRRSAARAPAASPAMVSMPTGDPLMWVAGALAWSHFAGRAWRGRIEVITAVEDVTRR